MLSHHVTVLIVAAIVLGLAGWVYLRIVSPRPEFPPLQTAPDDPLMLDAMDRARASLQRFLSLARRENQGALVKIRFVSSTDQVEHLWAKVLDVSSDTELGIRLVTPPVTHSGRLERLQVCRLEDVEDWQVRNAGGSVHVGFTQRAIFAIAGRDGVELPRKLLEVEREYVGKQEAE